MAETNGLLNRQAGLYLSRGFESRPLRCWCSVVQTDALKHRKPLVP